MVFGPSTACAGTGTYEWQSDGDTLTLTAVELDECVRRHEALDGPIRGRNDSRRHSTTAARGSALLAARFRGEPLTAGTLRAR